MDSLKADPFERLKIHTQGVMDAMAELLPGSRVDLIHNCLDRESFEIYRKAFDRGDGTVANIMVRAAAKVAQHSSDV